MNVTSLAPGSVLHMARSCPLPQIAGEKLTIEGVRTYLFGADTTVSYRVLLGENTRFQITVAEDKLGYYLAISRELSSDEQDQFFGRDALGFFKEASSAKTIRCKADPVIEAAWTAPRYSKTVDWVAGSVTEGRLSVNDPSRKARDFRYNLLADESGEKALEIEHFGPKENKVYLTVYRPADDIEQISEPLPHIPTPMPTTTVQAAPKARPQVSVGIATNGHTHPPASKPDFRRHEPEEAEPIHIGRAPAADPKPVAITPQTPPLPSFLLSRENSYLSLDEILTPDTERMRCDLTSAKILIDTALKRRVHVREIMRELLGLESQMADEAVFELPLSDKDYQRLAQRYRLRPNLRAEIRACLQEELRLKLLSIAKN